MSTSATTELRVTGMTCNNCARHVTEAIQGVANVHSATVSLPRQRATVQWASGDAKVVPAVLEAITRAGFEAREITEIETAAPNRWQWTLLVGLAVTGALMLGEWGLGLAGARWFQWLAFVLAGFVQIYCGAQFYSGAWRQLKVGQANMDALVVLGSTTSFGYSTWALLSGAGGHLYFLEAAAIISLISFGHWIEARVGEKAGSALKALLNLAPQTARKLVPPPVPVASGNGAKPALRNFDFGSPAQATKSHSSSITGEGRGTAAPALKSFSLPQPAIGDWQAAKETEVPVADLETGDRVALRPGDRVPVDGVVVEGESIVDEAMLTGESAAVDKKSGNQLFAGTVNLNGRLIMRVTATGADTALAHIVAAVQRAQTSRANIQRLGDRVSNVFVPVIVAIALAAGLWWGLAHGSAQHVHELLARFFWHSHVPDGIAAGFIIAAAVLIIACPCAMGLATPAAIMASANAAARLGILIRDGVALEKAGGITTVVFDKTGTLTVGAPQVAEVWQSDPCLTSLPALALGLAAHSTHPISRAIANHFSGANGSQAPASVSDWREIRGGGIEAKMLQDRGQLAAVRLGSLRWLRECGVDLAPGSKFAAEWSRQGATIAGLASDNRLLALVAVRDAIKAHSAQVIAQLHAQQLKTSLLTGDNVQTAAAIAKQVGIPADRVHAEVRPEQKAEFIKQLQARGERVAFVGDGINDAPALTQADLGIAVSRASDIAREAADIILLKSEIEAVPEALGLARATLRTIKQNLFWAFFYNALGVPLAALGFISPIFCAAAMGFSDLIVIGNALRLLRWRPKRGRENREDR